MKLRVIITVVFISTLVIFYRNLNPFSPEFFTFHDVTQSARIEEYVVNIQNGIFPPKLGPHLYFEMSHPMLGYYSPLSYFIATPIHMIGADPATTLKLDWILAAVVMIVSSFMFFRLFFSTYKSLFGSFFYSSGLYIALNIFVRGNLAETWFLALSPLAFYVLLKPTKTPYFFFFQTLVLFALFICHNALSFLLIPILILISAVAPNRILNFTSLIIASGLSMFFWLPLFLETSLTHAREVAEKTKFVDHFLCPSQLWTGAWGFGGSAPGCISDGMAYQVGKPQLVAFAAGLMTLAYQGFTKFQDRKKSLSFNSLPPKSKLAILFAAIACGSLFMTTYLSAPVWSIIGKYIALLQFPWRFIGFGFLAVCFLGVWFIDTLPKKIIPYAVLFFITTVIFLNAKYFYGQTISNQEYNKTNASAQFIREAAVYSYFELTPKTVNLEAFQLFNPNRPNSQKLNFDYALPYTSEKPESVEVLRNDPFYKEIIVKIPTILKLNTVSFPYWQIKLNGIITKPESIDELGRPSYTIKTPNTKIIVEYNQTFVSLVGNTISILSFLVLTLFTLCFKRITTLNFFS